MKLHEKIKALREYRNISQEKACIAYGISRPSLSQKELGIADFWASELEEIAKFYGCSPGELMDGTDIITINLWTKGAKLSI